MRRHLSVLLLFVRHSIYKVLLLLAGLGAAEALLFWRALSLMRADPELSTGLELAFENAHTALLFGAAFLLLCVLLAGVGCELGSRQGYTLNRLSIGPRAVLVWQAVCNCLYLLLFWAVQILLVLLLCRWYVSTVDPANAGPQTIFLAFYRSDLLHALLPMEHTAVYVRNAILLPAVAVSLACWPARQRRGGGLPVSVPIAAVVATLSFRCDATAAANGRLLAAGLVLAIAAFNVYWVSIRRADDETELAVAP